MKKMFSVLLSAAMLAAVSVPCSVSAEEYGSGDDIVIFGDSVAAGKDLSDNEYNYGQLIANYVSGSVTNYAVPGSTSGDTLETINNLSSDQKAVLADAEYVIISAGSEDLMEYTSSYILNMCADINVLKSGYTAADIPERPNIFDISDMVDRQALSDYATNPLNMLEISTKVSTLRGHLTLTKNDQNYQRYDRVIETRIMPALEDMVAKIKAVNPDAEIIIQTVYNPMQFQENYLAENFPENYRRAVNLVVPVFTASSESYRTQLKGISGIKTADVLASFSSTVSSITTEQSYSWYFTGLQNSGKRSIYPTQTGHVAIAATILNTMGRTDEKGTLLRNTFQSIENKDSYPAYALAEFKKVVDLNKTTDVILGDADGNGVIDSSDASLVLKDYASTSTGSSTILSSTQKESADVNSDGIVDSSDASTILKFYSYTSTGGEIMDMREWLKTV